MPRHDEARFLTFTFAVLFAVLIAAGAMAADRKVVLGIPRNPGMASTNFLAAMDLGYFAEEGITLTLQRFPTTAPIMEAVATKKIDIGGGGVFPLVVANQPGKKPVPIRFFYNHLRKFEFEIVVPPNSPLKTIADLKGKKLAVTFLNTPYAPVTRVVMKDNGLAPGDVRLVPIEQSGEAFRQLMEGKVDAYEAYSGNAALFEANDGPKLRRLPYAPRISNLLTYSYYAHEDMFKTEPKVLGGFGRAIAKGVLTCKTAPEWCVKTFWKHYPELMPAPEAMGKEMARLVYVIRSNMNGYLAFPPGNPRRFGEYPADAFRNLIDVLHEGGELPSADIDTNVYYTNAFVDQINDFDAAAVEARAAQLK